MDTANRAHSRLFLMAVLACTVAGQLGAQPMPALLKHGKLSVRLADNSRSPQVLSGLQSLFHADEAAYDAFDPEGRGSSAGLNFEHIISGHADEDNRFTPRHGRYDLTVDAERHAAELVRREEDSPWGVASRLRYELVEPHYVDFEFRCRFGDVVKLGQRGYAVFFFADYMNQVADVALHFRGKESADGEETWIRADARAGHVDYNGGGTYRAVDAEPLEYDADHNFKLNLWSYDWPRYTEPFYYGRADKGMTLILMFDRRRTEVDEIRLSLFKFKVREAVRKPAWDFQYVVHEAEAGREFGFRGRLVWKKFTSPDDCRAEYVRWRHALDRAGQ